MELRMYKKCDVTIIEIPVKINSSNTSKIQKEIFNIIDRELKIIIDMSGCVSISNSGARLLLSVSKQISKHKIFGAFVNINDTIREVLHITGFDNLIKDFKSIDMALQSLKTEAQ